QASLANETDYKQARRVADNVVTEASNGRYITVLADYLTSQSSERRLTDVERWLYALIVRKMGHEQQALDILTAETAGSTPVIAFERAKAFIKAKRSREAVAILMTLLAEQPDNLDIRLLLAEEMSKHKQTTVTLQLLASVRFDSLPSDVQDRYATLVIRSHIMNGDVGRLLEAWEDIAPQAYFDVLQAMGDT